MTVTTPTALVRHRPACRGVRADPLMRALAVANLAGLATLALVAGATPPSAGRPARVALVMDARSRPADTLARARDWAARADRRAGVSATVRLRRTDAEALTDVRYLAAQGYETVVVAGPRARAAAARAGAGGRFPHTRFERRAAGAL